MRAIRFFLSFAILALFGNVFAQIDGDSLAPILRLREQAERDEALALALAYGIPLKQQLPDGRYAELAKFFHGQPLYRVTDNVNAAITTRANRVHPGGVAGLSLTGSGLVLGIWDGGAVRASHQEFGGRVSVIDVVGNADHATHVAGTMLASGVNAAAKGMAWGSTLRSYDWNNDGSEMSSAAANNGMVVSNHSYSYLSGWSGNYWYGDRVSGHTEDAGFGYYDYLSLTWDQIAISNPYYTIFKSAGNDRGEGPASQPVTHKEWSGSSWIDVNDVRPKDGGTTGYDTLPYNSVAKNIMVVGSVDDVLNYTGPASVTMPYYSGWGPTDDGRIKPDIVANGQGLTSSTSGSDTAYGNMSGTSMSSPNAAGSAALIVQHYKNLTGGNPFNYFLRGLIIHTALECGPNPGPDYMFGWGLMNVEGACALLSDNAGANAGIRARAQETLANGGTNDRTFTHNSGSIKVTICWNDAPGTPPAWMVDPPTKMLKYDLDVRLVNIGTGATYSPWILDPANPANAATTGDNSRDNVEQIYVADAPAGQYRVRVTHKGTLPTSVNYCLLTDGFEAPTPTLQDFSVSPTSVVGGQSATVSATLSMAPGSNTAVTVTTTGPAVASPTTITVASGQTSGSASLSTNSVATTWSGTLTATLGSSTRTASFEVRPAVALQNLSLDRSQMVPGADALNGTVTLSANAASDVVVNLTDNSANLTTPATVTVLAGSSSQTFSVTSTPVTSNSSATVSASYDGTVKSTSVSLLPLQVISFSVSPTIVTGGQSFTASATLNAAPTAAQTVAITASGPLAASTNLVVGSGQASGSIAIATNTVTSTWNGTLTATFGSSTQTATLEVRPVLALQDFTLDRSDFVSGSGALNGTVRMNVAPMADTVVSVTDDSPNLVTPGSVTVSSGTDTKVFSISNSPVTSTATASVSASYQGVTKTASVVLRPYEMVDLSINPTAVTGGDPAVATVTLNAPVPSNMSVLLTSNGSPIVGTTLTVLAGNNSGNATLNTRSVQSFWTGTVTATMGSSTRTTNLQVMPTFGMQSLVLDKSLIIAGETPLSGTVITTAYAPSNTTVSLADNSPYLTTPASVFVPQGSRVATFDFQSVPVTSSVDVTVTATISSTSRTAMVTLRPANNPGIANFAISPGYVFGGDPATAYVTLEFASGANSVVSLTSNGSPIIGATLTIPAGQTSGSVTLDTRSVRSFWTGTVTATLGESVRTATLQIMPPFALQSLALDKSSIIGGETPLTGLVITTAYAPQDTSVSITTDSPNLVPPSSIMVVAATRVKYFDIGSAPVSTETPASVSASLNGLTKTVSVTLCPAPALIGFVITPEVVTGGSPINGSVTISRPAPSGGLTVNLSDNTSTVNTPPTVVIPEGQTVGYFTCTTIPVTTRFRRQITATYRSVVLVRDFIMEP